MYQGAKRWSGLDSDRSGYYSVDDSAEAKKGCALVIYCRTISQCLGLSNPYPSILLEFGDMECMANRARWRILAFPVAILSINVLALFRPMSLEVGNRESAVATHEDIEVHRSSFRLRNTATVADSDGIDRDDISWLRHVKVGKLLGNGKYSDTFAAVFDDEYHEKYYQGQLSAISGKDRGKSPDFIIRITGNYHDGANDDSRMLRVSERAWNISQRLSPHPSIPIMLQYVRHMPNPFLAGRLKFAKNSNKTWTWAEKYNDGRLFKATSVSIDLTERVHPTVEHYNRNSEGKLTAPACMVRCFWRQMFETMSYVHSRGVSLQDTKLWNVMVHDGKIVLFDFNMGKLVDIGSSKFATIHEHDVRHFGKRVREYVDGQRGNSFAIDLDLLEDLYQTMENKSPPPTMAWLLENSEYFVIEAGDECLLQW